MSKRDFKIYKQDNNLGLVVDEYGEVQGMVVLDDILELCAANDLACRWNCKAGKCGSCSAEINGNTKASFIKIA